MWAERSRTIFLASPANHGGQRGEPRARRAVARASNASKDGTAAGSPPPRVAVRAWRRAHAHHRTPARGWCLHLVYAPAVTCHEPPATTARRTLCLYISVAPTSVFGPSGLTCPQQRARSAVSGVLGNPIYFLFLRVSGHEHTCLKAPVLCKQGARIRARGSGRARCSR